MAESVAGKVVVITGASSGIGRATAQELARRGATLVLAARSDESLDEAVRECQELGGRALAIPTEVSNERDVEALAQRAIEAFGGIDVWINNAGVYLAGRFEDVPSQDFRRVIETNLFGVVNGTRAVWSHFKQRRRGTLINLASVASDAAMPFTSAYSASKAAIRTFSDCLRMELHLDKGHDIKVCTVMPAAIDTPLFQHAGDYEGREVRPPSPVYPVEEAATTIADLVEKPQREVTVGRAAPGMLAFRRLAPSTYEKMMAKKGNRDEFTDRPARRTSGNLFAPTSERYATRGGWLEDGGRLSSKSTALLLGLAAVAAVPVLVAFTRR